MAVPAVFRLTALAVLMAACSPMAVAQSASIQNRPLVQKELTGELVGNVMLAEIAAARGQIELAANLYFSMAQATRNAQLAKRATELTMQAGLMEKGAQAVRLWVELEPEAPGALQTLAKAMSGQVAKLEDMEVPLRQMLESETAPVEVFIDKLPVLLARYPDKQASLALIEKLTQPHLRYAESHLARARAALDAGEDARAERAAQRALDIRPDLEPAARIRALSAPASRWPAAMEELGRFGKRFPQARHAREQHARWLVSVGRKSEALTAYKTLLADFPLDEMMADRALGQWVRLDRSETPEALLRRLLAEKTGHPDVLRMNLAVVLDQQGKTEEALRELDTITDGPVFMNASLRRIQILATAGRADEARAVVGDALRAQPQRASVLIVWQAAAMAAGGRTDEALKMLEGFLGERPDEADVLFEASMLADRLKRYDDMERWVRRVIELRPDDALAFNALGYSFADRNLRLPEAERLLTRAVRLMPDSAAIIDSVGWLRFRQGRLDESIKLLRQAQSITADTEISVHLGEALWRNGQRDEARKVISEAERLDPDNEQIKDVRQRLMQ